MLFLPMNGFTEAEVTPRQANTFGKTLLILNVFAPLRARLPNSIFVDTRETLGVYLVWARGFESPTSCSQRGAYFSIPANTVLDRTTEYPRLKERFVVSFLVLALLHN
jgi:hypothetical protein